MRYTKSRDDIPSLNFSAWITPSPTETDSRGRLSLQIGRGYPSPTFYLFTLHSSLFTLHPSLFTLHSSLFTLHSSLFTQREESPHDSPCSLVRFALRKHSFQVSMCPLKNGQSGRLRLLSVACMNSTNENKFSSVI